MMLVKGEKCDAYNFSFEATLICGEPNEPNFNQIKFNNESELSKLF